MRIVRPFAAALSLSLMAVPVLAQELTGTLKMIKDTGAITIGHREASIPFSYLDRYDGGYWISALTSHNTMPPPVLYGFGPRDERQQINQTIQDVLSRINDAGELRKFMVAHSIRYVYIGPRVVYYLQKRSSITRCSSRSTPKMGSGFSRPCPDNDAH